MTGLVECLARMHGSLGLISVPHKLSSASPGTWEVGAGGWDVCHQAEELAYSVESLSHKRKDLSLDHCHLHKSIELFKDQCWGVPETHDWPAYLDGSASSRVRESSHACVSRHMPHAYTRAHMPLCSYIYVQIHTCTHMHPSALTHTHYTIHHSHT